MSDIFGNKDSASNRKGDWLQVYSGRQFWPLDARTEDVDIVDIAHSLSLQCRYGGHVKTFYSVAEHCLHVSANVPDEFALVALLHDASEAYLVDLPRPVKSQIPQYKAIEKELEAVIAKAFGLQFPWPEEVMDIDNRILLDERAQLMSVAPIPWGVDSLDPVGVKILGLSPKEAETAFLSRFLELVA